MTRLFPISALSGALVLAGTVTASAGLIDFTDNSVSLNTGSYTVTGVPSTPNRNDVPPFAPIPIADGFLKGDNDGLGIFDDELATPGPGNVDQYVTITFNKAVRLTAAYFLDVFIEDDNQNDFEQGRVIAGAAPAPGFVFGDAVDVEGTGQPGLVEITGLNLRGTTFTFWAGDGNDGVGFADGALAAVTVAPIPLPASGLLLLGAVGGMAVARRRAKT